MELFKKTQLNDPRYLMGYDVFLKFFDFEEINVHGYSCVRIKSGGKLFKGAVTKLDQKIFNQYYEKGCPQPSWFGLPFTAKYYGNVNQFIILKPITLLKLNAPANIAKLRKLPRLKSMLSKIIKVKPHVKRFSSRTHDASLAESICNNLPRLDGYIAPYMIETIKQNMKYGPFAPELCLCCGKGVLKYDKIITKQMIIDAEIDRDAFALSMFPKHKIPNYEALFGTEKPPATKPKRKLPATKPKRKLPATKPKRKLPTTKPKNPPRKIVTTSCKAKTAKGKVLHVLAMQNSKECALNITRYGSKSHLVVDLKQR